MGIGSNGNEPMTQVTERETEHCARLNTLQDVFRSQAREMLNTIAKLTDGIGTSSEEGDDRLLDDYTLSLANEVMQTLYALVEKQVDAAGWFKRPIEN